MSLFDGLGERNMANRASQLTYVDCVIRPLIHLVSFPFLLPAAEIYFNDVKTVSTDRSVEIFPDLLGNCFHRVIALILSSVISTSYVAQTLR